MNLISFSAYDGDQFVAQSDWMPERGKDDALNVLTNFRRQFPNLAYRIKRTGDSKQPNPVQMFRYRIKVGEALQYSRPLFEHEREKAIAEIREMFPKAEIVEEKL